MNKKIKRKIQNIVYSLVILLVVWLIGGFDLDGETALVQTDLIQSDAVQLIRVIDGDTVVVRLNNQELKVRLIGIDAPEVNHSGDGLIGVSDKECLGKDAALQLNELISRGNLKIRLDKIGNEKDKYGRTLAYLYSGEDTKSLNEKLVEFGFAKVYLDAKFEFKEEFIQDEQKAEIAQIGIWDKKLCFNQK